MSLDNKAVNLADLKVSHDYLVGQDSLLSERIDTLGSGIDDVESFIGDLSDLSTTLKDNLVDAINEVLQTGGKVKSVNGKTGDVVLKTSDLTNDSGYLTSYTETDPTVPSWAKQQQKPSYTASEVGAATTEALTTEITTRTASDAQLQSQITALGNGAPIPVETVAEMIDNTKAYLYTGAEAGWLTGYWYTYDSTQAKFVPRGEYGVGTVIDDTLTVSGDAADAKATGDAISEVKAQIPGVDASLATAGKAADAKATGDALTTINGRLLLVEDELGVNPPDVYTGTITQAATNTTIADNLSFERATQYKYKFEIGAALNTDCYFVLRRGGENDTSLFYVTISPGATSIEKIYTTSASYDITEGYIYGRANATGVNAKVTIEPTTGVPTRLDTIETDVTAHGTAIENLTSRTTTLESKANGIDVSVNRLNPFTATSGYYINTAGTQGRQTNLMYTDYIRVKPGDIVYLVKNGVNSNAVRFRYVTAYDSEKTVIPASGTETTWKYTVPAGVAYLILTLYIADYEGGGLAININGVFPYSAYNDAADIVNYAQRFRQAPYTTMPDYVLGGAWYKPMGGLSQGYFCFVTDDGRIGMNTYTIPTLVIGKGVKCTFAIMSTSEVMADAEKIAVVKDAVDNYGCSVAQHGGNRWTTYNEYGLNQFFDSEKAFFDSIGIEVRGAVIPEHYNSKLIYAVAGGKYGVVRSGYEGHIFPTYCPYENYSNGPRSNLYGLTSYNIIDKTLDGNKAAVDSALANHRLMIVYIHETGLTDGQKAVIEGLMDYVNETGITQITLGDIPNII